MGKKAHLPLVFAGRPDVWRWPVMGFGQPTQYGASTAALRAKSGEFWWYDWTGLFRDARHVPMVWGPYSEVSPACNDGRPLLILNEPELEGQADCDPDRAADVVHLWAGQWNGELWPLGTLAHSTGYVGQVIDSYQARYGSWPGHGWSVHAYAGRAAWSEDIVDPARLAMMATDLCRLWEMLVARGVAGRGMVLSECGALSAVRWHWPHELLPAMRFFASEIRALPFVRSWCWFSSFYEPFNSSDLVYANGELTELGLEWVRLRDGG